MRTRKHRLANSSVVALLLLAAPLPSTSFSKRAIVQASGMVGIGHSDTIMASATIKAIDLPSHVVTLIGAEGDTVTIKVGDEVRNLPQVKPGDKVSVRYDGSVTYVLSPRGA